MADQQDIKVALIVGTAPLWVPVAAAGGLVYGVGKGIMSADDFEKKNGSFGSVAWPFIVGYNIISGPLKGIKKVGDVLIGN